MLRKALPLLIVALMIAGLVWAAEEDVKVPFSEQQQAQTETKWSPQYGEKGELLNGEPAVAPFGANVPGGGHERLPQVQTVLLDETFSNWGPYGDQPPAGWTIQDNGTPAAPVWNNYDWFRYVGGTGWDSSPLARIYGSSSSYTNDDWFISPSADYSGAAACTLSYRYYYDDYSTVAEDSFLVYLSDDGGATWAFSVIKYAGADSGTLTTPKTATFDISAFAAGKSDIKVAFRYYKPVYSLAGYAGFDNIRFSGDTGELLNETMDSAWGAYGDNPPAGWTVIDAVVPDPWNNNDWHKYYYSTWTDTIARVYYSPVEGAQNEWLITPALNFSPAADQILFSLKQFYDDYSTTATDSAWILGSLDGGATWPQTIAMYTGVDEGSSSSPSRPVFDITSWANGQTNVKLAFKFVNQNTSGGIWYMDSVKVETITLLANDVATTAINSPTIGATGYNLPVNIQVYNNGTNTATFTDYAYIESFPRNVLTSEDFNEPFGWTGANPPTGWTVIDSGSAPGWDNTDWHQYYNSSSGDYVARVYYASGVTQNEWLISPSVNATSLSEVFLSFRTYYNWEGTTDTAYILGTADNWATTIQIDKWFTDHGTASNLQRYVYDISSWAAGQSNVKIAFKYIGLYDLYWYVDDAEIFSPLPTTTVYNSNEAVSNLLSLESRSVAYASTFNNPNAGDYAITSYTNLGTDGDRSNDSLTQAFTVYEHYESGGPDAGYYSWNTNKDGGTGEAYSWVDITGIGTPVTWDAGSGDDRYTYGIDMGFSFPFYANNYSRIFLKENGLATFDSTTATELTNYGIPSISGAENMLAFLWDDLDGSLTGSAYYYTDNVSTFIVSFIDWDFFTDHDQRIDVQFILDGTDGSIKYQYQTVGPVIYTSHTIGIENAAGDAGLQFVYNTNPLGNIAMPGLAITFTYNPPAHDVAALSIASPPGTVVVGTPIAPKTVVSNLGGQAESFPVYFYIYDDGLNQVYSGTANVTNLAPLTSDTVTFANYTPLTAGDFSCVSYTVLPTDSYAGNDTATSTFVSDMHYGEGGPDAADYRWIDNTISDPEAPTYSWIDITGDGTLISTWNGSTDDGYTYPINMGIPGGFNYYGHFKDSLVISTNGWVSFERQTSSYLSNYNPPSASGPRSGVFVNWDDMHQYFNQNSRCYYKMDAPNNRFIVSWVDWCYHGDSLHTYNFQVILDGDDSSIVAQYGPSTLGHQYDITLGIQDSTRTIGLSYYYGSSTTVPGTPRLNVPYTGLAIKYHYSPLMHNMAADQFLVPGPSGMIGQPFTPQVRFSNNAQSAETNVPVRLIINPGGYNNTQNIASIAPGATADVNFLSFTPSTGGAYTLTAIAELGTDQDRSNDTLVFAFTAYDYVIDFEANDGSFDATNDWMWGQPLAGEPPSANSGLKCWGTAMDDNVPTPSTISDLDIPIQITGASPIFTFYDWYEGSTVSYYFRVLVDDGTGFVQLSQWMGSRTSWAPRAVDLSAYSGVVTVRLEMEIGTYTAYSGWYVDDFSFAGCHPFYPANEVAFESIDAPAGDIVVAGSNPITATVRNRGTNTVSFNVQAADNHGFSNTGAVSNLAPGASTQVTITGWNPLPCSVYTVTVTTQLPGDEDPSNNSGSRNYTSVTSGNTFVQYDDGTVNNAWRWTSPFAIMANEFPVPYQGATLNAVTYQFTNLDHYPTWPDSDRDTVELSIYLDDDHDGMPDATPVLTKRDVAPEHGPLVWNIACESIVSINCESFWAGWAQLDTATGKEGMCVDAATDYPTLCWYGDGAGGWAQTDAIAGDEFIRVYFNNPNPGTAPDIAIGSLAVSLSAPAGGNDSEANTLDNVGTSCGVRYWVDQVFQRYTPLASFNNDQPIRFANPNVESFMPTEGEIQPIKVETVTNEKGTTIEPEYPPVITSSGGPDVFGYTWIDSDEPGGPAFSWIDISGIGTPAVWDTCTTGTYGCADDGITEPIALGFSFNFYGVDYTAVTASSNGWLSFQAQTTWYLSNPTTMPSSSEPNAIVAPLWDDLSGNDSNPGQPGEIRYYQDVANNRLIISWDNWGFYSSDSTFSIQVILDGDDNSIVCQYNGYFQQTDYTVGIENQAGDDGLLVAYNQAYVHDDMALAFYAPIFWLSTDLVGGWLPSSDPAVGFNIAGDATDLTEGTYTGAILIGSDDPDEPVSTIVVTFNVTGGGGNCMYRVGDINGNGTTNGIDVTYGVIYFKGGAEPPVDCGNPVGPCPQGSPFYAAGDVNGNCVFNGIDITFFVNYLKGITPALLNCPSCPPGITAAPAVMPPSQGTLKARPVESQQ